MTTECVPRFPPASAPPFRFGLQSHEGRVCIPSRQLLDLIVVNTNSQDGARGGSLKMSGRVNHLYHNEGGGRFSRVTSGDIAEDKGNARCVAWGDYDGALPCSSHRALAAR